MERRTIFEHRLLPMLLVAPQLLLTLFFFVWPAAQAVLSSTQTLDPFGQSAQFVGLDNFSDLFADELYRDTILRTIVFCAAVAALSMGIALLLAVFARPADTYVAGFIGAPSMNFLAGPAPGGERLAVRLPARHLHVFDGETGQRIDPAG
jgi:ABC-type sugar transport system permease subunit